MTSLSLLIVKKVQRISTQQYERIIFALCRLDAWRVRDSIGTSRTVLFSLPGQSCIPILLPLIQKVFVHDRHVFVYDGCCPSVEYGMALTKQYGSMVVIWGCMTVLGVSKGRYDLYRWSLVHAMHQDDIVQILYVRIAE